MNRQFTIPATPSGREAKPERPYLWRGKPWLAEVNDRLMDERPEHVRDAPHLTFFSWPMPLPGPPHPAGNQKPKRDADA